MEAQGEGRCPICGSASFAPTGKTVDIVDVLDRWEQVVKTPFPDAVRQKYSRERFPILTLNQCRRCGFGAFEPRCEGDSDFYAVVNAHDYYVLDKWEFTQAIEDLQRIGAQRILDVGCGSGGFLKRLRGERPSLDLVGYEIESGALASVRAEGFAVLSGNPAQFGGDAAPFDALCMFQVLEHVEDPIAFLNGFTPLLKPGGHLIVSTPDEGGPIRHFWQQLTEVPPHHVTKWTETAYRYLFRAPDYRIREIRHEPLPDYLWESYLPELWGEAIWPRQLFDQAALARGRTELLDRVRFAIDLMKAAGISHLTDVPGHTIYAFVQRP